MDTILKEFCRKHNYYLNYDEEMKEFEKSQGASNSTGDSSNKNRKLNKNKGGGGSDSKTVV